MEISILGTYYDVQIVDYSKDKSFEENNEVGYCNTLEKQIRICDIKTHPDYREMSDKAYNEQIKQIVTHEMIHAHLFESGLDYDSNAVNNWAVNEEMVDWFAMQMPKIAKAVDRVMCLWSIQRSTYKTFLKEFSSLPVEDITSGPIMIDGKPIDISKFKP